MSFLIQPPIPESLYLFISTLQRLTTRYPKQLFLWQSLKEIDELLKEEYRCGFLITLGGHYETVSVN